MLKQALEYIVDLSHPFVRVFNGYTYADKKLIRVPEVLYAESIQTNTLTGLCDYIKSNVDDMDAKMLLHVVSPTKVRLLSALDAERGRECLMEAHALLPEFTFGRFMGHEEFCIALQSKFIKNDDRDLVLKFAGTVEDGTVTQYRLGWPAKQKHLSPIRSDWPRTVRLWRQNSRKVNLYSGCVRAMAYNARYLRQMAAHGKTRRWKT